MTDYHRKKHEVILRFMLKYVQKHTFFSNRDLSFAYAGVSNHRYSKREDLNKDPGVYSAMRRFQGFTALLSEMGVMTKYSNKNWKTNEKMIKTMKELLAGKKCEFMWRRPDMDLNKTLDRMDKTIQHLHFLDLNKPFDPNFRRLWNNV